MSGKMKAHRYEKLNFFHSDISISASADKWLQTQRTCLPAFGWLERTHTTFSEYDRAGSRKD
jgi:hypothetical protein